MRRRIASGARRITVSLVALTSVACHEARSGAERFVVPRGATLDQVADTLAAHGLIETADAFQLYARLRRMGDRIKAGTYEIDRRVSWSDLLDALVAGRVVTVAVTIPEGWTVAKIAERIAPIAGVEPSTATRRLLDPELSDSLGSPGPTLEGYLFPDTYRFAEGVPLARIAAEMLEHYRTAWTPAWRAALDSTGLSERAAVTLASIVQAEARWEDEMPLISAVYHNRLKRGMRLQADPTVQYALTVRQSRLLFSHIDSVADHPYNTYTHVGLPPGPIGSPGMAAIEAALRPADAPYLYFVARDDGRHEFSRTLREHNRTIQRLRGRHR